MNSIDVASPLKFLLIRREWFFAHYMARNDVELKPELIILNFFFHHTLASR